MSKPNFVEIDAYVSYYSNGPVLIIDRDAGTMRAILPLEGIAYVKELKAAAPEQPEAELATWQVVMRNDYNFGDPVLLLPEPPRFLFHQDEQ